jgi:predicted secreted hydrolase
MKRLLPVFGLLIIVIAGLALWQRSDDLAEGGTQASLLPLLSEDDTAGFARATEPDAIRFPRDLGPHDHYQTEWWYYTGNLETAEGRQYGYQLTFFRRALLPPDENRGVGSSSGSEWRSEQVYLAHFALGDIEGEAFYFDEQFARGAAGLAGAQADPYHVWLEEWQAVAVAPDAVRLTAETEDVALDLVLTQTLPPILHGDGGLSAKGPTPGNASHYYSFVQQETAGTVRVGAEQFDVTGLSWKDHEYSTSALEQGAVGWDWFSLQFDNGGALMFFQIRRADGSLQAESSGSLIHPDGSVVHVPLSEWELEVTDTWTSPETGAVYPAAWRLRLPGLDLELEGSSLLADQELRLSTVYWEGAVSFSGTWEGRPISAAGYVEMTGYYETMEGRL